MTAAVLTTNTQTNLSGVPNQAVGKVVTDSGTPAAVTFTLGFAPRYIKFVNATDRTIDEWWEGMQVASTTTTSLHTAASGSYQATTLETTNGIQVVGNTFTVTATTMAASKTFYWHAVG